MNNNEYKIACKFLENYSRDIAEAFTEESDRRLLLLANRASLAAKRFCENGWDEKSDQLFSEWMNWIRKLHEKMNK